MIAALKVREFEYIPDVGRWRKFNKYRCIAHRYVNNIDITLNAFNGMNVQVTYIDEWAKAELKALFEAVAK